MEDNKVEEGLYIKILVWIYKKQDKGFHWKELKKEFNLDGDREQFVLKLFRPNTNTGDNLIDHPNYSDQNLFVISSKGMSEAIHYLHLKEAENSSRRAERIALISIFIGFLPYLIKFLSIFKICLWT